MSNYTQQCGIIELGKKGDGKQKALQYYVFKQGVLLVKMECDIVAFFFNVSKKLEKEIINEIHLPALKEKDFKCNTVECGELISYFRQPCYEKFWISTVDYEH